MDELTEGDEDPVRSVQQVAAQRRLEAEEDERLAALDSLRNRALREVAHLLCVRGAWVEVDVGTHRFSGRFVAVGTDWVAVANAGGTVDVRLAGTLVIREVDGQPPRRSAESMSPPPDAAARTFSARLAQLELSGAAVEVGTGVPAIGATGRLEAAARDHVVIVDAEGVRSYVAGVAWVRSRT